MELLRSGLPSYYYICKLQTEYDMENRLTVGFTHGDVNGIGYELIIKMMAENRICEVCTPVLFGSSKVAAYHRKALNRQLCRRCDQSGFGPGDAGIGRCGGAGIEGCSDCFGPE